MDEKSYVRTWKTIKGVKMKKLIIALLVLGMMACHQPENTSLKVVEVDVNSADYRKDEAAFKHFDFVKLDTVSEALLSDVSKVLVGEDRLYVLPMMDPRVFIFDGEGKYIHSLKRGQGPGEIRFVYDIICVSPRPVRGETHITHNGINAVKHTGSLWMQSEKPRTGTKTCFM